MDARSPEGGGGASGAACPLDATAIELATGLSIADVEALGTTPSPDVRSGIAVKFAREFDRLAKRPANRLASDLLVMFSKDPDRLVRMRFAEEVGSSPNLPPTIAASLARDDIDIALPILRHSPVLDEAEIGDIVKMMPEIYAFALAERRPLGASLVELLMQHKGTIRMVARLLDNDEAELSEAMLSHFHEWGQSHPDIAARLGRRPNLPFAIVNQNLVELAQRVHWPSLGDRTMTKFEATRLQRHFEGRSGHRCSSKGDRFLSLYRLLKQEFERGLLEPSTLLGFLRDRDIDRLECGLVVMSGLDLRWVRNLLHGSDRRGLIVLCLKAEFSIADYLAFRMALSLAELGAAREQSCVRYPEEIMKFASDQFEKMRADPHQLKPWLPPHAA